MKRKLKLLILLLAKYAGCFALARYLTRRGIVIVAWHGVSMDDEHIRFPAYFIEKSALAQRIQYLKKHYRVISLDEAVQMHADKKIAPRCAVLTFDDGQYNFASEAVPVLKRENVTGTVYVLSSMFSGCLSRNLVVRDIFLRAQQAKGQSCTAVRADNLEALEAQRKIFADSTDEERPALLRKLGAELGVDVEPILQSRMWHFLSSKQLSDLSREGFDVQVHTHTHKTVVEDEAAVYDEARICREKIEEVTQKAATDYCYPSGLWHHGVWESLQRAGMRSAVTCKIGPNFAATPPLALRRYVDDSRSSQLEFESLVSGFEWLLKVACKPSRYYEPSEACTPDSPHL